METYLLPNGFKLKVVQDENPETPREWDNLTKMIFVGGKKHLGDKHDIQHLSYSGWEHMAEAIVRKYDAAIIKPIYLYSHSGERISLAPFSCRWDSGQVGFVIVTKEAIRNEYNVKRVTKKTLALAESVLKGEIEVLDQYISGEVYGFEVIDENGITEDSCYGFFGNDIKENGILDNINEEFKNAILTQIK